MSVNEGTFEKRDWDDLIWFIKKGKCTPFIDAGACYPYLPLGGELAYKWSSRHGYPLKDSNDLPKVAQFMAIDHFDMFPKHVIAEEFQNKDQPDFFRPDEPDGVLADCKLPIYELVDGECGEVDEGGDEEVEDEEVFN